MVYNNFILRFLFSTFFIFVYSICAYIDFKYVFFLILLVYFLILIEIYFYFKIYKLLPIIYILVSLIFFMAINLTQVNFLNFNLFILIVITFDIFSYITGKIFGNKKLIKISPNKTYEGLIGGIIFSFLISLSFLFFFEININIKSIFFIFIIILSSLTGDLIESYFKRRNKIKNSSNFVPGHGGVFDRFDSFLFSIIFYSISIKFLI